MKEWMELVDYKVTEGDSYGWSCFGPNSHQLASWNGVHGKGGYSFNIVFSTKTHKVYSVEVCDYTNDRAYRMINPDYVKKHEKEAKNRGVSLTEAWDDVNFVDLDVDDDFIQKSLAIKEGKDYDTRVSMPIEFTDEEFATYARMAHDMDLTLNQFIEQALRHALDLRKATGVLAAE
jgi:hypothetical protein